MNILHVIILSIIEGLTEFLPISSTGHLILASNLLKLTQTEFVKSFEIFIQLGAICAIAIMYYKKLILSNNLWKKIGIAFLPTGLLGFTLYKLIKKKLLGNSLVVVLSLLLGGIILIFFEKYISRKKAAFKAMSFSELSYKNAIIIGLFQSFSMIPGVSRAAASIVGAMLIGLDRKSAVEFSFLLAIPTMAAATGLDLVKSSFTFTQNEYFFLLVGFIGSFITAWFTVKIFLKFVQNHTFVPFGIYRILLAIFFLIFIR